MGKKTLSEELSDFLKPQNFDYDIEDSERITNDNEGNDQEISEDEENEELKKEHYIKVAKSKLRDDGIKLNGPKYDGDAITRKDLYEENHQVEEADEQEEEAESSDSKIDEDSEVDLSDISSSSDEQENDNNDNDLDKFQSAIEENKYKRDKIKSLINNGNVKSLSSSVATAAQVDALKGFHILKQQSLYDSILDFRIKIQKGVNTYNHFPNENSGLEELKTEKTSKYIKKAESSLYDLLDAVMQLRLQLYKDDKLVKSSKEINKKKRSLETYFEESKNLNTTLNAYRGVVLTKWSQKVQSASGAAALNASKFKAVNQSAETQVENNLANMDRLVKRTRLNRKNVKPLGYLPPENIDNANKSKAVLDPSLQENESIFDDEDFYRLLLRELVDKKVNDTSNNESIASISLTKTAKFKKNVDTKASKGRKLNYKVQESLQNWEAPKFNKNKWDDYQIDEFFAGLFGQRINMNEDTVSEEPASNADQEAVEEAEEIANDDIQLFA